MIESILLIASFLVFVAVALYAKVRSGLGIFIVLTGLIIGILNLIYVVMQMV